MGRVNDCRRRNKCWGGRAWPRTGDWEQAGRVWLWAQTVSQAPYQPHNNQPSFKSFCRQSPDACFFTPPKMCCPPIFKVTAAQTATPLQAGLPPPWTTLSPNKPHVRRLSCDRTERQPLRTVWVCSPSTALAHPQPWRSICSGGGGGGGGRGVFTSPGLVHTRLRPSGPRAPVRVRQRRTCSSTLNGDEKGSTKQGVGRLWTYAFLLKRSSWRGWDSRSFQNMTVEGDIIITLMQILKIHASFLTIRKMVPQTLALRATAVRVNSNNDLKGKLLICTISESKLFPQTC